MTLRGRISLRLVVPSFAEVCKRLSSACGRDDVPFPLEELECLPEKWRRLLFTAGHKKDLGNSGEGKAPTVEGVGFLGNLTRFTGEAFCLLEVLSAGKDLRTRRAPQHLGRDVVAASEFLADLGESLGL